jgi:replicative DNA helicase
MEAEQAVLGAILIKPAQFADILELLTVGDFYREAHGRIYQAMLDLLEEGVAVDIVTVSARLRDRGQLEGVGGSGFLMGLSEEVGYATNIVTYAQMVHDKSTLRRLIEVGQGLCQECFNGKAGDIKRIIEVHQNKIAEIEGGAKFKGSKNIAKRIRSYLEVTDGNVEVTKLYKDIGLVTEGNKKAALVAIGRLVKEGILAKIRPGFYRVAENDALPINILETDPGAEIPMRYPFGLEKYFITYQKTLILISGEPDAGKTAWLLNIARDNMHLAPIYYWSSEMGGPELISRLESFEDFDAKLWAEKVKFAERDEKFEDVVKLYPDAIHIIDNLEMHEDFYLVGKDINAIWRALGKGVAIIGLHKERGKNYALGGMQMAKRPKLWINLEPRQGGGNVAKVCKAKNWRDKLTNIKNMALDYHLVKGCRIIEME